VNDSLTDPLALYVHWPFCVSKCPYCDFNSHVRDTIDQQAWKDALIADLRFEALRAPARPLTSIFFGGGTPSLMPPDTIEALIREAERLLGFSTGIEITLEANPSSVEASAFADLALAGINRVSLGLQALDDAALRFLGRAHDVHEGLSALDHAQHHFSRVSFDLIYARPGQTLAGWENELRRALSFGTGHLSLYQLTIEPGTRFAALHAQGRLIELDEDLAADLFEATRSLTFAAGLPAYEISNHARIGEESRHNLAYWRYADYLGVGPGAHGRRSGLATERHRKPENWMAAIGRNGHGLQQESPLSAAEQAREALVMGLRLSEGIDLDRIGRLTGLDRDKLVDDRETTHLRALGFLETVDHRLKVTEKGAPLLDRILRDLVSA
jgi:oxygen-independent coproporphyrinogen-3 oxidase